MPDIDQTAQLRLIFLNGQPIAACSTEAAANRLLGMIGQRQRQVSQSPPEVRLVSLDPVFPAGLSPFQVYRDAVYLRVMAAEWPFVDAIWAKTAEEALAKAQGA